MPAPFLNERRELADECVEVPNALLENCYFATASILSPDEGLWSLLRALSPPAGAEFFQVNPLLLPLFCIAPYLLISYVAPGPPRLEIDSTSCPFPAQTSAPLWGIYRPNRGSFGQRVWPRTAFKIAQAHRIGVGEEQEAEGMVHHRLKSFRSEPDPCLGAGAQRGSPSRGRLSPA